MPEKNSAPRREIVTNLLARMKTDPPEAFKNRNIPLPPNTLSKQEFGAAMSHKWLTFRDKRYYFTDEFAQAVEGIQSPNYAAEQSDQEHRKPRPQATRNQSIEEGELARQPQGACQAKILEIIYRGKNKLGHPNLLLMTKTGDGQIRRVERGIPLPIATAITQEPNRFNGRVIAIDEKANFVGIILAQTQKTEEPDLSP